MLKINKLADYGLMVMSCLAQRACALNAREIAELTHLSVTTVSKVLKMLTKAEVLISERGIQGGYRLSRAAETISLTQMLEALDGDMAITECAMGVGMCTVEHYCGIRHNWKLINQQFQKTLNAITLADMLKPAMQLKKKLSENV